MISNNQYFTLITSELKFQSYKLSTLKHATSYPKRQCQAHLQLAQTNAHQKKYKRSVCLLTLICRS
jgi:hypothetical protein